MRIRTKNKCDRAALTLAASNKETMMRIRGYSGRSVFAVLAASTAIGLAPSAWAQEAVSSTSTLPVAAEQGGLQDIIVTARKRIESAQNIPVSVTALSQERIERYDLTSLEKISASTPQLQIGRNAVGAGAQISLRGIGTQATSIGLESSTAIIIDGVYYGYGHIINEGFFDLARVEILKGPQALFFGKNATAGVVSLSSADPTDKLEMMGRVGYEFRSKDLVGEGYVSGPLTDTLGLRVAVRATNMYGDLFKNRATPISIPIYDVATGITTPALQLPNNHSQPGTNEKLIRVTLKWKPTSELTVTLKASAARRADASNASNFVPFACPTGFSQNNPAVVCKRDFVTYVENAPAGVAGSFAGQNANGSPYTLYRSYGVTGTINYELDNVTVTSVSNYNWHRNKWDVGGSVQSATSFVAATENTSLGAFSNETRITTSFDGPINLMVGEYYQKMKRNYAQYLSYAPLSDSSQPADLEYVTNIKNSYTKGQTISGFGQVSWKILSNVEATGGIRYTHETKNSLLVQPYVNAALVGFLIPNVPFTADQTFNNWSPEATITWKPVSNITVYGAYKTGYKSGGFSNSSSITFATLPSDVAFQPEKVKGFEGGIKTMLFDRQLRFNVGVYSYKYSDLQVDFFDSVSQRFITTNAGSVTTKGVELEAEFAPRAVSGLTLRGTANYNKTRYQQYIAPCYAGESIAAGCNTTFPAPVAGAPAATAPFTGQNLSGAATAGAPLWTASLGGDYEHGLGGGLVLGISTNARYSSSYFGSSFGAPLSRQGKYISVDASVRVKTEDDRWEFALLGRNLTNNFHINGVQDAVGTGTGTGTNNAIPADQLGFADLPRTIRAQITWRY
jgi:iron complex outermembrane receptor protein